MSTATITRSEYSQLLKNQERLTVKVSYLESLVQDMADEEVTDAYAKKLIKWSKAMDKGKDKGIVLKTPADIHRYFRNL